MPAGAEFINPNNGRLVLSAEARGYRYLGQPTLISAGSITKGLYSVYPNSFWYGYITPYVYEITLPAAGWPLIGLALNSTSIVALTGISAVTSTTWRIGVYSLLRSGGFQEENYGTMSVTAPSVHVFCPFSNSDNVPGAGLQLFNSDGDLTFSSAYKPLWIKKGIDFAAGFAEYTGSMGVWTNPTLWSGQTATIPSMTTPLLLHSTTATCYNYGYQPESGEYIFDGTCGWFVEGTTLYRQRLVYQRYVRLLTSSDDLYLQNFATTALLVEGSGL